MEIILVSISSLWNFSHYRRKCSNSALELCGQSKNLNFIHFFFFLVWCKIMVFVVFFTFSLPLAFIKILRKLPKSSFHNEWWSKLPLISFDILLLPIRNSSVLKYIGTLRREIPILEILQFLTKWFWLKRCQQSWNSPSCI